MDQDSSSLQSKIETHKQRYYRCYNYFRVTFFHQHKKLNTKIRHILPGESIKRAAFEKIMIPEFQSNDVYDCPVLSPICQIRFSNLPGFNRSFLPVEIGDFL